MRSFFPLGLPDECIEKQSHNNRWIESAINFSDDTNSHTTKTSILYNVYHSSDDIYTNSYMSLQEYLYSCN